MDTREHEIANLYQGLWEAIDAIRTPEIVSQFLLNVGLSAEWFKGKLCLDVGCGSGFAIWTMEELGSTCYACDLKDKSLKRVRQRLGAEQCQARLFSASVLQLPFPTNTFDFVHCNGVLHHTINPRGGFAEIVRVTRPGGTLFVSLYGKGGLYNVLVNTGRLLAPLFPYHLAELLLDFILGDRRIPNSFMPAKISILDNMYVPVRHTYREKEIRRWFTEVGIEDSAVVRTRTTIYDHRKLVNQLIHGSGYLQFRATKRGTSTRLVKTLGHYSALVT